MSEYGMFYYISFYFLYNKYTIVYFSYLLNKNADAQIKIIL